MIWNRKEVFVGNSSERFAEVRNILSFNKIKHAYKIVDRTSPGFFWLIWPSKNGYLWGKWGLFQDLLCLCT